MHINHALCKVGEKNGGLGLGAISRTFVTILHATKRHANAYAPLQCRKARQDAELLPAALGTAQNYAALHAPHIPNLDICVPDLLQQNVC